MRDIANKAVQDERNRIGSEMHDDLAGGLTSIQLLAKGISTNQLSSSSVQKLQKIESYSSQLIDSMRMLIWAMDKENENLPNLVAYLRRYVVEYLDNQGLVCKVNIPNSIPDIVLSGRVRKNIVLCVKETIHNIIKHAKASKVTIIIEYKDVLEISIKDNGIGFKSNNFTGYGLKNMDKRMEEIGGKLVIEKEAGTTIYLYCPVN